jgi:16S rRNA (uracil1498-N3)-methyltransferase
MLLFYTPDITSGNYVLPEEESKHCLKVLRLTKGDELYLTDGKGILYAARITEAHAKHCRVTITGQQENVGTHPYYLHLAVAPTKNIERYEHLLEKTTEIGLDAITPLICKHSERRSVKPERLEKILVAAMKQSLKTRLPQLHETISFPAFLQQPFDGEKYIACCSPHIPRTLFWEVPPPSRKALVLIGPEGDFSDEEVQRALQAGFRPVSLGNSRLRTETAGMLACMAMYVQHA